LFPELNNDLEARWLHLEECMIFCMCFQQSDADESQSLQRLGSHGNPAALGCNVGLGTAARQEQAR